MGQLHHSAYVDCGVEVIGGHKGHVFYKELVDMNPDYVSVCSYDDAHFEQTMYALERGCKVIVEKPLCLHWEDLCALSEAEGEVCCNLPLSTIKLPEHGYHYEADYLWGRVNQLLGWRSKCPEYSFVHGAGVHVVDAVLRNSGGRRITEVCAYGDKTHGFPRETMITVIGKLENFGTVRFNINCAFDGEHQHRFVSWCGDGKREIINTNSDKTRVPKDFIEGRGSNLKEAIAASCVCFAIEASLQIGENVEVSYL